MERTSRMGWRLMALAGLVIGLGVGMHPTQAWAVECAAVLADPASGAGDSDGDGFTDFQECDGIPLDLGSVQVTPIAKIVGDPNKMDIFIIYNPVSPGSLLPDPYRPFESFTAYGITFNGLAALGVNVHQLTPGQAALDRKVSGVSVQKAVRVTEDLNASGSVLGQCQWGTPMGLDGCIVYTQRVKNFIDSTCNSAGDTTTDRNQVFLAYVTQSFLHEVGHSLGGLAAEYNSRFGGYHYKAGAGVVMEQAVTYSTKGGQCTWYISPGWNATLDPPAVKLK